ncbi:uncharacterized protein LOC143845569 [Tasmannia lanceolata]|uniref:uncharacterized protein LOC143845569 n=1 Tax=Tasmannia lanceolata TaxID=3420 RepID=UPI00406447A6
MLEGKGLIQDTDMPMKMQLQAMGCASKAPDLYDVSDCKSIAAHIKKEFDMIYGFGWQCVVGSNFGCFFTHTEGTFIYFCLETLTFLIFKGGSVLHVFISFTWVLGVRIRESDQNIQRPLNYFFNNNKLIRII